MNHVALPIGPRTAGVLTLASLAGLMMLCWPLLLDAQPKPREFEPDDWEPRRAPAPGALVAGAVRDALVDGRTVVNTVRGTGRAVVREVDERTKRVRSVVGAVTGRRPKSRGMISGELSHQISASGLVAASCSSGFADLS